MGQKKKDFFLFVKHFHMSS